MDIGSTFLISIAFLITFISARTIMSNLDDDDEDTYREEINNDE